VTVDNSIHLYTSVIYHTCWKHEYTSNYNYTFLGDKVDFGGMYDVNQIVSIFAYKSSKISVRGISFINFVADLLSVTLPIEVRLRIYKDRCSGLAIITNMYQARILLINHCITWLKYRRQPSLFSGAHLAAEYWLKTTGFWTKLEASINLTPGFIRRRLATWKVP
jgi:hypothetical protein